MELIDNVKKIITGPTEFFQSIRTDDSIGKPWTFYMLVMLVYMGMYTVIGLIVALVWSLLLQGFISGPLAGMGPVMTILMYLGIFIGIMVLSAVGVFIQAAIIHLFLMIVGAKKSYIKTFKGISYSEAPIILLGPLSLLLVIPLLGGMIFSLCSLGIGIYVWVLQVIAMKELHEISIMRSVMAVVVIPLILGFLLLVVGIVLVIVFMSQIFNASPVTGFIANTLGL